MSLCAGEHTAQHLKLCNTEHKPKTDDSEIALANLQTDLSAFMHQPQPRYKDPEHESVTTTSR